MKRNLPILSQTFLLVIFALSFFYSPKLFAQATVPFDCSSGLGYILTNRTEGGSNVTSLYSFDLSSGNPTLIKADFLPGPTNRFFNALAYNSLDNFLYGYVINTNQIGKVDANGNVDLITVNGLTPGQYAAGDITSAAGTNGYLCLYSSSPSQVVIVDIAGDSVLFSLPVTLSALNNTTINDFAFSPVDGNVYGVTSGLELFKLDVTTASVLKIGNISGVTE